MRQWGKTKAMVARAHQLIDDQDVAAILQSADQRATVAEWFNDSPFSTHLYDFGPVWALKDARAVQDSLEVPDYFNSWSKGPDARTRLLPGKFTFSMGKDEHGFHLHTHGDAWSQLLVGKKLWTFMPPNTPVKDGVNLQKSHRRWMDASAAWRQDGESAEVYEVVQNVGDVVYIPEGWQHGVLHLGETVAIGQQRSSTPGTSYNSY